MIKKKSGIRSRNIFDPASEKPFRISRTKVELFVNCPRCFYLDRRLGVSQPPSFPFNLNNAVDTLLKKEFDHYRGRGLPHPIMTKFGIKAVPFQHESLETWRDSLRGGIEYYHEKSNLILAGGVDDLWLNQDSEICVVDYKATAKAERPTLDADWQMSYKRQIEMYVWLFRKNNFKVSDDSYFVYCNADVHKPNFQSTLFFDVQIITYKTNTDWIEDVLVKASACLRQAEIPPFSETCNYCLYNQAVLTMTGQGSWNI